MHCICEGVVEQLLNSWLAQDLKKKTFDGDKREDSDKDLQSIKPISEITRTPRSIVDEKDWKGQLKNILYEYCFEILQNVTNVDSMLLIMGT